mgnify:CR=1 FL=1
MSAEELHAIEAEIDAARAAGLPILDPPTAAERVAAHAAEAADEVPDDEVVPPLVEVEPTLAAFEEMRLLGPVEADPEPELEPEPEPEPEPKPPAQPERPAASTSGEIGARQKRTETSHSQQGRRVSELQFNCR